MADGRLVLLYDIELTYLPSNMYVAEDMLAADSWYLIV